MPGSTRSEWLTLGEASRMLGVDPDTLRRWADAGKVEVFHTPGRHRRFQRAAIEALVPSPPRGGRYRSLSGVGAPVERVAAEFRRRVRAGMETGGAWADHLDEADRAAFRAHGHEVARTLLEYLDTPRHGEREALLQQAEDIGRMYGARAKDARLSLGEATQALLFFRTQFLAELASVARRRALSTEQATRFFEDADRALDRMLLALITAHQERR